MRVGFLVIPALPGAGSFDVRVLRGDGDRPVDVVHQRVAALDISKTDAKACIGGAERAQGHVHP